MILTFTSVFYHSLTDSLIHTGWFWLRFAHFSALRPVLPGGPEALLHGGRWDGRCHLPEGQLRDNDPVTFKFFYVSYSEVQIML